MYFKNAGSTEWEFVWQGYMTQRLLSVHKTFIIYIIILSLRLSPLLQPASFKVGHWTVCTYASKHAYMQRMNKCMHSYVCIYVCMLIYCVNLSVGMHICMY